jgi:hypothetical protein
MTNIKTITTHTPGPWDYRFSEMLRNPSQEQCEIFAPDGTAILRCAANRYRFLANARLIAAAPELLEALAAILPYARAEAEGLENYRGEDEVADEQADAAWVAVECAEALLTTMGRQP